MGRRLAVGMCTALCVAALAHAQSGQQYYRWKDASGATHYSDTPPSDGRASRVAVDGRVQPSAAPAATSSTGSVGGTEHTAALDKAEASAVERNCRHAKANLAALQGNTMVVDSTDIAKARRMGAEDIAKARVAADADVRTYCGATR